MSRLFVDNIPFACTQTDLQQWFEAQGYEVTEVELIQDKLTGQPRGFGFVELRVAWKTEDAIKDLHRRDFGKVSRLFKNRLRRPLVQFQPDQGRRAICFP